MNIRIDLTGQEIIRLLAQNSNTSLPVRRACYAALVSSENATVTFTVPSGGDWSGMDVAVDTDHPITVLVKKCSR
jgi:hypothetical protein